MEASSPPSSPLDRTTFQDYRERSSMVVLPNDLGLFSVLRSAHLDGTAGDKENRDPTSDAPQACGGFCASEKRSRSLSAIKSTTSIKELVILADLEDESTIGMGECLVAGVRRRRVVVVKRIAKINPAFGKDVILGAVRKESVVYCRLAPGAQYHFILQTHSVSEDSSHFYIIMPRMPCSLAHVIDGRMRFPFMEKGCTVSKMWIAQMTCAVAFLHENGIIHTHLKPRNILINWEGQAQVYDFVCAYVNQDGSALRHGVAYSDRYRGSEVYASPEMRDLKHITPPLGDLTQTCNEGISSIITQGFGTEADAWSLGCIFAELLRRPTKEDEKGNIILPDPEVFFREHETFSYFVYVQDVTARQNTIKRYGIRDSKSIDLVLQLLNPDPQERLQVSNIGNHSYFMSKKDGKSTMHKVASLTFEHHIELDRKNATRAHTEEELNLRWSFGKNYCKPPSKALEEAKVVNTAIRSKADRKRVAKNWGKLTRKWMSEYRQYKLEKLRLPVLPTIDEDEVLRNHEVPWDNRFSAGQFGVPITHQRR